MRILLTLLICVLWPSLTAAQDAVRARLVDAAQGTRALVKNATASNSAPVMALEIDVERERLAQPFATKPDVARYTELRPWTRAYTIRLAGFYQARRLSAPGPTWPQLADAPALRLLLADPDPAVRSLAIEALATLHEPSDVERIARLLADEAAGLPALGWNSPISATNSPYERSELDLLRSWHGRSVGSYARVALRLMTGRSFDDKSFAAWWPRHRNARASLWFWDERIKRTLAEIYSQSRGPGEHNDLKTEALRTIREDLHNDLPEVEAKVCLLAPDSDQLGRLRPCDRLRLGADRLLDLLDRKNLWDDVEWNAPDSNYYNALVYGISSVAQVYFRSEHVARLQAVMARERSNLWWNGNAALRVAVSRLLPLATNATLDQPTTGEGFLRDVLRRNPDLSVRREAAQELIRVGVARNWPLLEQQFFADTGSGGSDLRGAILSELGAPPFTADKRTALATLLLDRRFDALFTRPSRVMGDDMYRQTAIWAVNAHAGQEVLTVYDKQELAERSTAAKALAKVKAIVIDVLGQPR
jgi:hypothetical protein